MVEGGGNDGVGGQPIGGQTVKNIKVRPWGTLMAAIMAAKRSEAVGAL